MYVASPDALMQIFPLIIKNFFRKHGCLFFLRACVSGVPLILIHLFGMKNPLSSITTRMSSEISLKLDIFAMLTLSISNSHSSQQWQSAHCQSKSYMSVPNQSIECSAKKSILLHPHHNLLWEWQPWRRLTMWPRTKGKMSSHCPHDALLGLHAKGKDWSTVRGGWLSKRFWNICMRYPAYVVWLVCVCHSARQFWPLGDLVWEHWNRFQWMNECRSKPVVSAWVVIIEVVDFRSSELAAHVGYLVQGSTNAWMLQASSGSSDKQKQ